MMNFSAIAAILSLLFPVLAGAKDIPLEDGDIIFQQSMSRQSTAIQAATHSNHTHMGIIFFEGGVPYVYEAVQPVKKTGLSDWIKRGKDGSYEVRRLKKRSKVDMEKLRSEVISFLGKDYDAVFGWSDSRIYCSELVWKAYDRACGIQIGKPRKLKDLDLNDPVVKETLEQRYGKEIPYDMEIISPADMYRSQLLRTVKQISHEITLP